jgi:hypothetical protein
LIFVSLYFDPIYSLNDLRFPRFFRLLPHELPREKERVTGIINYVLMRREIRNYKAAPPLIFR